jgi:hypothetical protein
VAANQTRREAVINLTLKGKDRMDREMPPMLLILRRRSKMRIMRRKAEKTSRRKVMNERWTGECFCVLLVCSFYL